MNPALDADRRAELVLAQMSRAEKQTLVFGYFATDAPWKKYVAPPEARAGSAGYVPGIPRLGIPPQWETDAGIGVATQGGARHKRERTALPSGLATAATWDPELARAGGAMIGAEARASGFNVMLAGGVNLVREPRNGRNFEYGGEDPLLAGMIVGAQIARHRVQPHHLDDQALRAQRPGDRPRHGQRDHRSGAGAHVGPAGVPDRDRAGRPGRGHVRVQQGVGRACLRERVAAERTCCGATGAGSGYVMSDWGATHSTAKAARSRRSTSSPAIRSTTSRTSASCCCKAVRGGRGTRGAAGRDGAAHPAHDVRQGRDRPSGRESARSIYRPRRRRTPSTRARARSRARCCSRTTAHPAAARRARAHRGDRRPRRQGRAGGRRVVAGVSGRRQRRARHRADDMAGAGDVLPVVAAARHPGAGAAGRGAIRER